MGNAFPFRSDCSDIPIVPAISGSLVSSCYIPEPPPPEITFPPFESQLPPPPGYTFGCYAPAGMDASVVYDICVSWANVTYHIGPGPLGSLIAGDIITAIGSAGLQGLANDCAGSGSQATGITFPYFEDTGWCQPYFSIVSRIPCPPITISGGITMAAPGTDPAKVVVSGGKKITILPNGAAKADCAYDFFIQTTVPCPIIYGSGIVEAGTDPNLGVRVEDDSTPEHCIEIITLNLKLGIDKSVTLVCDVTYSCAVTPYFSTPLVTCPMTIKKQTLYFTKGVLISVGSCA